MQPLAAAWNFRERQVLCVLLLAALQHCTVPAQLCPSASFAAPLLGCGAAGKANRELFVHELPSSRSRCGSPDSCYTARAWEVGRACPCWVKR